MDWNIFTVSRYWNVKKPGIKRHNSSFKSNTIKYWKLLWNVEKVYNLKYNFSELIINLINFSCQCNIKWFYSFVAHLLDLTISSIKALTKLSVESKRSQVELHYVLCFYRSYQWHDLLLIHFKIKVYKKFSVILILILSWKHFYTPL